MANARIRKHYVVESVTEIINYKLRRGDTVYNMEDGLEYVHVSYATPIGYNLQQLNALTSKSKSVKEEAPKKVKVKVKANKDETKVKTEKDA